MQSRVKGFTLVELLVVVAIIGVLVALLLPAIQSAREAARRSQCANNLRQMGLALQNYHDVYKAFPYGGTSSFVHQAGTGTHPRRGTNWRTFILPFLEQQAIFDSFVWGESFTGRAQDGNPSNGRRLSGMVFSVYACPSSNIDPTVNWNNDLRVQQHHYIGIAGAYPDPAGRHGFGGGTGGFARMRGCEDAVHGVVCNTGLLVVNQSRRMADAVDGTSNQIMIAEQSGLVGTDVILGNWAGGWAGSDGSDQWPHDIPRMQPGENIHYTGLTSIRFQPNSITFAHGTHHGAGTNTLLHSRHPGGINVVLADASTRFLNDTLDMETLRRLASADDRLPVGNF